VVSIDSHLYGSDVLGILFYISKLDRHLVFGILPFPLVETKCISCTIVKWLNCGKQFDTTRMHGIA